MRRGVRGKSKSRSNEEAERTDMEADVLCACTMSLSSKRWPLLSRPSVACSRRLADKRICTGGGGGIGTVECRRGRQAGGGRAAVSRTGRTMGRQDDGTRTSRTMGRGRWDEDGGTMGRGRAGEEKRKRRNRRGRGEEEEEKRKRRRGGGTANGVICIRCKKEGGSERKRRFDCDATDRGLNSVIWRAPSGWLAGWLSLALRAAPPVSPPSRRIAAGPGAGTACAEDC